MERGKGGGQWETSVMLSTMNKRKRTTKNESIVSRACMSTRDSLEAPGGWLSQIVGISDFYSPTHLSRHNLLFNPVSYLERSSLQWPGLLTPFPGHVDIRGRWMWLTDRL